jgi:hypothetical protein
MKRVPAKSLDFVGNRLAVVNVGDNAEITNVALFCHIR